jgi:hypothetical protein
MLPVDRIQYLVSLFQRERTDRLRRLLAVPRAAVRAAQTRHNPHRLLKNFTGVGYRTRLTAQLAFLGFSLPTHASHCPTDVPDPASYTGSQCMLRTHSAIFRCHPPQ